MSKIFIKVKNDSYELVDKTTGEVTELTETIMLDEEHWLRIYADVYCFAIDSLTGNALKTFGICLKLAKADTGQGNCVFTNDPSWKKEVESKGLTKNIRKYIKELSDKGFISKVAWGVYALNPQIAYCGERHNRAKLILNLIKE